MANAPFDFTQLARELERCRYHGTTLVATRSAYRDAIRFDMQCRARGRLELDADIADPRLWRDRAAAFTAVMRELDALYQGVHAATDHSNASWRRVGNGTPLVECALCKTSQPVPGEEQALDFEFCERQAVLWMQRAEQLRKASE